jgi:ABC-type lipoprotein release transport system permease subunit
MIKLFLSGLRFYWRAHTGVLLGTMLATMVLTGSLLVGDSVDGSLRTFALQRLGGIHSAMVAPNRFFSAALAGKLSNDAAAVLQLRGMALSDGKQVNRVQVLGCDARLWPFAGLDFQLSENDVALNEKLAAALGVQVGDEVSLRIGKPGLLSRDAPLASQKDSPTVRGRVRVRRILGDDELGRFSLSANQVVPYNAFVHVDWLAGRTGLDGKANLVVAAEVDPASALSRAEAPEDFGFSFREAGPVVQLESEQIYLEPEAVRAAMTIPGAEGTLTYLVNSIAHDVQSTPYSFVLAGGIHAPVGDDEIVINRWLADSLGAGEGDWVSLRYFELLPSNRFEERQRLFVVRDVVEMDDLQNERRLAPQFPGLTDVDRCTDWDVGIPMEETQLEDEANEAYWNQYRQTPKAVVSLKAGQEMWSNRFGRLTSVRWPKGDSIEEAFHAGFNPAAAGYQFLPVRTQAIEAVDEAMDFGQLFVGMSFFLIVASLMLTGLLFVFSVQQRAEEMGILLATGWKPRTVRGLFLAEGGAIALAGSVLGAGCGTIYTKLLIAGLSRYWEGAVANSAIRYFSEPQTVATGAVAGFACALLAIGIAMWRQAKHPARELLMADFAQEFHPLECRRTGRNRLSIWLGVMLLLGAAGIVIYALTGDLPSITMPFFGAGALLLVSGMLFCRLLLSKAGLGKSMYHLSGFALRNAARRPGRSLAVAALLACGCFLVFAVSSMKEDVTAHADEAGSGSGGFAWFGESTLPISDPLGGVRLRVRDGDDASCLNLNRARSPRMLGVDPDALSARRAFIADEDLWPRLKLELPEGMVPGLVGDSDTAMWGLEARTGVHRGDVLDYQDAAGKQFKVKLVGKLPMRLSVFQGTILIDEARFTERFPDEEGYRMFLLDQPADSRRYERAGLDVVPATERLLEFYAVESTYLAMFLVLGAMGLAVGSMGMGLVVLRNVQDRRAEIALLRAVGYRSAVLRTLLFIEHGLLLAAGLGVGLGSAAVAMTPALLVSKAQVQVGFLLGLLAVVTACGVGCIAAAIHVALQGDTLRGLRNE